MEQNFQTSFIPKKSIVKERVVLPSSVSFLSVISMFILFATLVGTGALYFYKAILVKDVKVLEGSLVSTSTNNELELVTITKMKALADRLNASNEILSKHIAVSPIFEALQALTMKTVRFKSFNYTLPEDSAGKVAIKMSGVAIGYRSVALQADLFAKNKNLIDPVFSNLQLDDKGNVTFDLTFFVDQSFANYQKAFLIKNDNNPQ